MNYASILKCDLANGPGFRTSIFVTGCPIQCRGCHNKHLWDRLQGKPYTSATLQQIIDISDKEYIAGLSVLRR